AEAAGQLTPSRAARLRSEALENVGDHSGAAAEARTMLDAEKAAGVQWRADDVLRTAALLVASGDDASAASYVTAALTQVEGQLAGAEGEDRAQLEQDRARLKAALDDTVAALDGHAKRLVSLG